MSHQDRTQATSWCHQTNHGWSSIHPSSPPRGNGKLTPLDNCNSFFFFCVFSLPRLFLLEFTNFIPHRVYILASLTSQIAWRTNPILCLTTNLSDCMLLNQEFILWLSLLPVPYLILLPFMLGLFQFSQFRLKPLFYLGVLQLNSELFKFLFAFLWTLYVLTSSPQLCVSH